MSFIMPAEPQTLIDYAQRLPLRRRYKRLLTPTLLVLLGMMAWWWAPPAIHHAKLTYAQHRCLRFSMPADQVVFDSDLLHAPALLANGIYRPTRHSPPAACLIPADWETFYSLFSPPGFQSDGTVFLGKMQTPGGRPLMVAVDITATVEPARSMAHASHREHMVKLRARVFTLGSLVSRPQQVYDGTDTFLTRSWSYGPTRVYAGRIDPKDPSHLTVDVINYSATNSIPNSADIWLRESGTVDIEEQPDVYESEPPITPPPPPFAASPPPSAKSAAPRPSAPPAGE